MAGTGPGWVTELIALGAQMEPPAGPGRNLKAVKTSSTRRRGTSHGGLGIGGTVILMIGCLVVGALVAVAVMGGLDASKNANSHASANGSTIINANVAANGASAPAAPSTASTAVPSRAASATTQHLTTTTQRVTTTTSRASAEAVLVSRVVVAPASGGRHWSLDVPVTVRASSARIEKVHITGGPEPMSWPAPSTLTRGCSARRAPCTRVLPTR